MTTSEKYSSRTHENQRDTDEKQQRSPNRKFLVGLARAFAGALIFSLPMLMTMEMWWLGFYMDRFRLGLMLLVGFPLLVALSHFIGFKETFNWKQDVTDAFVAYAVGFVGSAIVLSLLVVIDMTMPLSEILGKVSLQAIPASIGAMLAFSQLGGEQSKKQKEEKEQRGPRYARELFLMLLGALFLAFNVAPTEEMILIAYKMSHWHALATAGVSLLIIHAFVYSLEFSGQDSIPPGTPQWSLFLRFTVVGYAIALLMSVYVLWTFGRLEGVESGQIVMITLVLGFPAAIGAAAARLIL
jgi:putative integral membrane protein (TIGR02587 family)